MSISEIVEPLENKIEKLKLQIKRLKRKRSKKIPKKHILQHHKAFRQTWGFPINSDCGCKGCSGKDTVKEKNNMAGTNLTMCRMCGEDYDKLEGTDEPNICDDCKQEVKSE